MQSQALAFGVPHVVERVFERRQHAQAQQVELHEPGIGAVVLVPLEHGAPGHARPLHRAHVNHGPVAQHHAAGVDAEVPGQTQEPLREVHHRLRDVVERLHGLRLGPHGVALRGRPRRLRLLIGAQVRPPVDRLGPRVLLPDVVAQGLGGVPDRRPGAVLNDVGHHRGVDAPKALKHVLDDLLAAVGLDVHVDVRRSVPLGSQEALEQQPVRHGVHGCHSQREAHGGVRGRAAALAQDVRAPTEVHDVMHDEEVAGKVERLDHREFVLDLLPCPRNPFGIGRAVPFTRAAIREFAQPGGLRVTLGHGIRRELRRHQVQVEGGLRTQPGRRGDGLRMAPMPKQHLPRATQVRPGASRQPAVHVVQRRARPYRREGGGQIRIARGRVVSVGGRDERKPRVEGEVREGIVDLGVVRLPGVGDLDGHPLAAEQRGQPVQLGPRRREALAGHSPGMGVGPHSGHPDARECAPHHALAAAREHQELPVARLGDPLQRVVRQTLFAGGQVRHADGPGEPRIPARAAREHHQVGPARIGGAGGRVQHGGSRLAVGRGQVQFRAKDAGQAHRAGGIREAHHPVQAVVIGQGHRGQSQAPGLGGHLLRLARSIQKAEGAVGVQFRIVDALRHRRTSVIAAPQSSPHLSHRRPPASSAPREARPTARPRPGRLPRASPTAGRRAGTRPPTTTSPRSATVRPTPPRAGATSTRVRHRLPHDQTTGADAPRAPPCRAGRPAGAPRWAGRSRRADCLPARGFRRHRAREPRAAREAPSPARDRGCGRATGG